MGRLECICKFPDRNGHEKHSKPLHERVVEFLKTQIRNSYKRVRELQRQAAIFANAVIFAHEKSQKLTRENSDQTKINK